MDSLLANYASSDEDDDAHLQLQRSDSLDKQFSYASSILFSLPRSKSSSIISLPPPKFGNGDQQKNPSRPGSTDLFSLLPKPKSQAHHDDVVDTGSEAYPKPKRFVQLKLPIMYRPPIENAEDDEEEQKTLEECRRKLESFSAEAPSVKSFLSSIPAPKNAKAALGALPSSVSCRRSITIETQVETPTVNNLEMHDYNVATTSSGNHDEDSVSASDTYPVMGTDADVNYDQGRYEGYAGHGGGYESYGAHEGNWLGGSIEMGLQKPMISESAVTRLGKRKKNEMPVEIVEVKQDELMKNHPREDQSKLTGIAFGPSYQPISSSKGKPSKLHNRKHQIGTLYYDMKQKEMELSERRAKGFLTKAETHAKYGW